jgi:small-conductance mechanosensitive channel
LPFAVDDFRDLLALLGTHPEWREELRRALLTEDLLSLPALIHDVLSTAQHAEERLTALAAAQQRTEEHLAALAAQVGALAAAQQRTEERLDALAAQVGALAAAQQRTEERLEALAAAQQHTEERLDALAAAQMQMQDQLNALRGAMLETRFREHGASALGLYGVRRVRVLGDAELLDRVDDAMDQGRITEGERVELLRLDAVAHGRDTEGELWCAVEVSVTGDMHDATRARLRAQLLAKLLGRVRPVVAALRFTQGIRERQVTEPELLLVTLPDGL